MQGQPITSTIQTGPVGSADDVHRHAVELCWIERLGAHTPSQFPHLDLFMADASGAGGPHVVELDVEQLTGELAPLYPKIRRADLLLALIATYSARISGESEVVFGYWDPALAGRSAGANDAPLVPLYLSIDSQARLHDLIVDVVAERAMLSVSHPYDQAIFERHVELAGASAIWQAPLPIAIAMVETPDQAPPTGAAQVTVAITEAGDHARIVLAPGIAAAFAERLHEQLQALAASVGAKPRAAIQDHVLMSAAERDRLERVWNDTAVEYPTEGGLIGRLERQAVEQPGHPAVRYQDTSLDYAEFNARVNRLARHLRAAGVGRDSFVGLCMDRSIELVIGIWATLKAGGAYVPYNVDDPSQRLIANIEDAGPVVVLTQPGLHERLDGCPCPVLVLEEGGEQFARESSLDPDWEVGPRDLAYMIYTSGSTGKPKGVLIEHEAILNRILWMQDAYQLSPADRVLQKTPYSFDVSVWEFLWPLSVGATLVVAEPGGHAMPNYLSDLIRSHGVTCMHFVPSMLRLFLNAPELDGLPLRMVFCSGEALSHELQELFFERMGAELHNLYGPTEAAVDVSYWHCSHDAHPGRVPIGKPIANIQLRILDDQLASVPVGVPGELHIGGIGLARGYWQRPELTAERFIPDPFSTVAGARLYKTGDLARFLDDGNIEYMGRNDHQVKINGLRIELGEIETTLRLHPDVRDAVVVPQPVGSGQALVGFLVADRSDDDLVDAARDLLTEHLPKHMVPRTLHVVDAIPLTTSGKANRKALQTMQIA